MKGVSIGDNTVVAAGSLVTHSLPANVVAGGVPAKVLKQIDARQLTAKR
jgi:acetyltransferase-like isoleucine patch superfamily enzyme